MAVQMASLWCAHDLDGLNAVFLIGSTLVGWFLALEIAFRGLTAPLPSRLLTASQGGLYPLQPRPRPLLISRSAADRIPYYRYRHQAEMRGEDPAHLLAFRLLSD